MRRTKSVLAGTVLIVTAVFALMGTSPREHGTSFDATSVTGTGAVVGAGVAIAPGFRYLKFNKTSPNTIAEMYVESRDRSGTLEDSMTITFSGAAFYTFYFGDGLDSAAVTSNAGSDTIGIVCHN